MTIRSPHRHPGTTLVALCVAAVLVAACGDDDDEAAADSAATETAAPATEAAASPGSTTGDDAGGDGGFPLRIENQFGTTEIAAPPERVATIGYTDGDYVLALGVTPVLIRDWYGDQPGGLWPWAAASPAAADSITVMQPDALNLEQIAAADPDVIIAMVSEIEQADYDRLTEIAPVVAQTDDYVQYGTPWDQVQLTIGRALGLEPEAQAIVDELEAQLADAAAAHPDWAGLTANFVVPATDGSWYAYTDQDTRGRLLTELGFVIPEPILELAGDLFFAQGSGEQLGLVDADLLTYNTFVAADRTIVDALPLWSTLPAVADGRSLFIEEELAGAMSFSTTLSIPFVLQELVPQIEATLGS